MEESLSLSQNQQLRQGLSPLQVQYVRLLEMNGPEVYDEVVRALDDNPALEREEEPLPSEELPSADRDPSNDDDDDGSGADTGADGLPLLQGHGPLYETASSVSSSSLIDYLEEQLHELDLSPEEMAVARLIVGNIDSNGYLNRSIFELADDAALQLGLDVTPDTVKGVLLKVRALDPAGVGAADLRDCLLLQLRRRPKSPAVERATEIVAHYFDLLSKMHIPKLLSATHLTEEQLREAMEVIRSLNPKPGAQYGGSRMEEVSHHITPDFIVETDGTNVTLTMADSYPALKIEESFNISDAAMAPKMKGRERDAMLFIRSKRDEAASLIRALSMRRDSLHKVMRAIIALQPDFFLSGGDERRLKPMVLRDVAAKTGLDVSVVSRATAGKYVATRSGSFPLKSLFNETSGNNADTASPQILAAIREIVEGESPLSPLSDEAIAALLGERGFDIARRTVAKYRERAGLPPARLRRHI